MDPLHIAVRSLAAYIVLVALLRVSGKRTISQGHPFDFVLALVLGDMVDDLLWAEVSLARFSVAASTLVLMQTTVALAQSRSATVHSWLEGTPRIVVREGEIERAVLRAERIHEDDLAAHLRLEGVERSRWHDVQAAHVENNGRVSVLKREEARPLARRDLQPKKT